MSDQDFFALEPIIVQHIKDNVPELKEVYQPVSLEDAFKLINTAPSVSVIWHDIRVEKSAGNGRSNSTFHQWMILLNVRSAKAQLQNTNSARAEADPLIRKILDVMKGFDPKLRGYRTFTWVNSPARAGGEAGQAYFPFLFEIQKLE